MNPDEAQAIWDAYYKRIRRRRISEAEQLLQAAYDQGLNQQTNIFLDYQHFSSVEKSLRRLQVHLAEDDDVSISQDVGQDYWLLDGTTRPLSMQTTASEIIEWVEFMADTSQSCGCVFSSWTISDVDSERQWSNDSFEANTE